jgi:peptidylprolyl isomerase
VTRSLPIILSTTLTAVLAAATLTACATGTAVTPCDATPSGAASSSVKVDGALDSVITVDAAFPLEVTATERSVLIPGTGDPLVDGGTANVFYAIYNGATGALIEDSHDLSADPVPFAFEAGTSLAGMESALHCATAGSRIAAVIPPADGFGDAGLPDVGLEPGQSLLLIADVVSIAATPDPSSTGTTPEGAADLPTPTAWTTDIPTVDLAVSPPVVTIPATAAPTDLVITVLEEGTGEVVPNPATVTLDYVGISWDTGEIFDSSYARGTPATFSTSGVIPGFAAAIVGQKVGSKVLVSIPPEYAYGTDPAANELGGQTLVFLIDIQSYE